MKKEDNIEQNNLCWKCKKEIDKEDNFCKHCGIKQHQDAKFMYTAPGILLYFLIVGPFCLLRLWNSPIIKPKSKTTLSVIIVSISVIVTLIILFTTFLIIFFSLLM